MLFFSESGDMNMHGIFGRMYKSMPFSTARTGNTAAHVEVQCFDVEFALFTVVGAR
jgi:hypothetical protein